MDKTTMLRAKIIYKARELLKYAEFFYRMSLPVSYTHLTLPTTPYV